MKVAELLEARQKHWSELEQLCAALGGRWRKRLPAASVARFSALYRAACADLALADAYQFPPDTIHYLHQLVGRAYNQLYRTRGFDFRGWSRELFVKLPRRLFADGALRLAFLIFWGAFLASAWLARSDASFAEKVLEQEMISQLETMFSDAPDGRSINADTMMLGVYVLNNPTIGLRCFAFGLLFGVGGLYETLFNAVVLGASFGHMAGVPQADNFFHFVTAHGPFELTAVVLCAAAGMRLGFSFVSPQGYSRGAAVRRAATAAMPAAAFAVLLFVAAALIEAFISPSALPYAVKAGVGIVSAAMLVFYFVVLGYPRGR